MGKILYLECKMGAAGDMLTAALLELIPDPDGFIRKMNTLGLPGVTVKREKAVSCGITGTHVSVVIDGEEMSDYVLEPDGILRVYNLRRCYNPWTSIVIGYTAGITDSMAAAIQELTAHRVTHALASSNGVQSEAAGGVSITYNATWTNNSRATALADDNKEVLAPYRLKGVF
jgi:hypothetical protein